MLRKTLLYALAVLSGFVLGNLRPIHAQYNGPTGINLVKLKDGFNGPIVATRIVGFSCSDGTCYLATTMER